MTYWSKKDKTRRKEVMFASLLLFCLSASLLSAAYGTEYWFVADSKWSLDDKVAGGVHFGLFRGINVQNERAFNLYIVCLDGECMFSCADTQQNREEQLTLIQEGVTENLKEHCEEQNTLRLSRVDSGRFGKGLNADSVRLNPIAALGEERVLEAVVQDGDSYGISEVTGNPTVTTSTGPNITDELEFLDYGLWVGTIACLSGGQLMAVVGALFAIINTATTPVEAITGVPGLYLWNGLAVVFDLCAVILWAVQFHLHLTSNVLLYSASEGWTTEGMEAFGYSYWLVVAGMLVHVVNMVIIALGTYEPKTKDQLQAPETKGGNIMLY